MNEHTPPGKKWRNESLQRYEENSPERLVMSLCPFGAFRAERLYAHYDSLQAAFSSVDDLVAVLDTLIRDEVLVRQDGICWPHTHGEVFFSHYRGGRTTPAEEHDAITDTWIKVASTRFMAPLPRKATVDSAQVKLIRDFDDPDRVPGPIERMFRGDARMMDALSSRPGKSRAEQIAQKLSFLAGLHGADPVTPFKNPAAVRGFILTISPAQRTSLGELEDELLREVCKILQREMRHR